ncbi:hypothetical protein AAHC03_013528 [Spirometra sp. Aus1]
MLKCVSKFPISKPWTLLAGSSYKCPMDTVENVLIIPRMDENCVVVYSCSAFANADRTEIVSIRVTIEVIANVVISVDEKQVYVRPGDKVSCRGVGFSELLGETVSIPLAADLWLHDRYGTLVYLYTDVIPGLATDGPFVVSCKTSPGLDTDLLPLLSAESQDLEIQYEPQFGKPLIPGEKIRCFTRILLSGKRELTELNGLLKVEAIVDGVSIVLADRVKQFRIPEWIVVNGRKVDIAGLKIKNHCTFENETALTWTVEMYTCDQVHYVTIEPLLGASISVGGTVRCATVQACEHRFVYSLYLTDVTGNYDDSVQPFFSNSTPLKITHDMLGSKIITCVTRGIHQKELRATRRVIIEGQPYGIQLIRKNQGDESLDIDVNIVNANETLQCDSGGYPRPEIIWQHVSSPKNHPTHQLTIHRDSLITTIFDPPGYYTYTCHSRNELGEISLKHTFYLRNSKHISFGQQTIVFCWVLANLLIFAFLVWMGQLIVNRDLIQFAED